MASLLTQVGRGLSLVGGFAIAFLDLTSAWNEAEEGNMTVGILYFASGFSGGVLALLHYSAGPALASPLRSCCS